MKMIYYLPTPKNISMWWNFGSMLGYVYFIQVMTGIFLAMHYIPHSEMAFDSLNHIVRDIKYGWLIQSIHMNGASLFFMFSYVHIGRGMYYGAYKKKMTWLLGVMMVTISMAIAFLGYVLPWGQMSFWGATVITGLVGAIPYIGDNVIMWIWGGFSVSGVTLTRFYLFHFILPFVLGLMIMLHILFLHSSGSGNPLGLEPNSEWLSFHPYFTYKDILGFILTTSLLIFLCLYNPFLLSDPDNFIPANSMVTPAHIQPEWYFLFAYAILRATPNKLGGVVLLVLSILVLAFIPFVWNMRFNSMNFYPPNKFAFFGFIMTFVVLTWLGSQPVEIPFVRMSQVFTILYFFYFILNPVLFKVWESQLLEDLCFNEIHFVIMVEELRPYFPGAVYKIVGNEGETIYFDPSSEPNILPHKS